jgi:hypothetical protein
MFRKTMIALPVVASDRRRRCLALPLCTQIMTAPLAGSPMQARLFK